MKPSLVVFILQGIAAIPAGLIYWLAPVGISPETAQFVSILAWVILFSKLIDSFAR